MIEVYIAVSYNAVDKVGGAAAILEYKGKIKDILYKKRLRIVQMIENLALLLCSGVIVFVVYHLVNFFAEK